MRVKSIRRPSASMAVAATALFASLGGVGYAAATIDSRDILNNSVRGKDVRNGTLKGRDVGADALGGKQIKESSLGKVPSAGSADTAGKATLADKASLADKAVLADKATTADSATSAQSAADADKLDGIDSTGFMASKQRLFEQRVVNEVSDFATNTPLATLSDLPAGAYMLTARLEYDNDDGAVGVESCRLLVPGTDDYVGFQLAPNGDDGQDEIVSLQQTITSDSPWAASVACSSDGDDDADQISLIAIALD